MNCTQPLGPFLIQMRIERFSQANGSLWRLRITFSSRGSGLRKAAIDLIYRLERAENITIIVKHGGIFSIGFELLFEAL